jgi:lipid A disaccharide synthetase
MFGNMKTVCVIAGEASGDVLGASLIQGLRARFPQVRFVGVGGPCMQAAGDFQSWFALDELSHIGLGQIVKKGPRLLRLFYQTLASIRSSGACGLLTIDAPEFCLRLGRRIQCMPRVHCVPPAVWAWRPRRARTVVPFATDHLLSILPFEAAYFPHMPLTFVGHPVADEPLGDPMRFYDRYGSFWPEFTALETMKPKIAKPTHSDKRIQSREKAFVEDATRHSLEDHTISCAEKLTQDSKGHPYAAEGAWHDEAQSLSPQSLLSSSSLVGLLPGSRSREIARFFPILLETAHRMYQQDSTLRFACIVPKVHREKVQNMIAQKGTGCPILLVSDMGDKADLFAACTMALAVSGTVTLELARQGTPMIVGYRLGRMSGWIARRLLSVRQVALANIVATHVDQRDKDAASGSRERAYPHQSLYALHHSPEAGVSSVMSALVPECLQEDFCPQVLAQKAMALLSCDRAQSLQKQGFQRIIKALRADCSFQRAGAQVLAHMFHLDA